MAAEFDLQSCRLPEPAGYLQFLIHDSWLRPHNMEYMEYLEHSGVLRALPTASVSVGSVVAMCALSHREIQKDLEGRGDNRWHSLDRDNLHVSVEYASLLDRTKLALATAGQTEAVRFVSSSLDERRIGEYFALESNHSTMLQKGLFSPMEVGVDSLTAGAARADNNVDGKDRASSAKPSTAAVEEQKEKAQAKDSVQVSVSWTSGGDKLVEVLVEKAADVRALRLKVAEATGVITSEITLVFAGNMLGDEEPVPTGAFLADALIIAVRNSNTKPGRTKKAALRKVLYVNTSFGQLSLWDINPETQTVNSLRPRIARMMHEHKRGLQGQGEHGVGSLMLSRVTTDPKKEGLGDLDGLADDVTLADLELPSISEAYEAHISARDRLLVRGVKIDTPASYLSKALILFSPRLFLGIPDPEIDPAKRERRQLDFGAPPREYARSLVLDTLPKCEPEDDDSYLEACKLALETKDEGEGKEKPAPPPPPRPSLNAAKHSGFAWATYGQIGFLARRFAKAMRGVFGLSRGDFVGICGFNTIEWSLVDFACALAG